MMQLMARALRRSSFVLPAWRASSLLALGAVACGVDDDVTRVIGSREEAPLTDGSNGAGSAAEGAQGVEAGGVTGPPTAAREHFPTSSVVFGEAGETTYVNVLDSLETTGPDPRRSMELAGWADLWAHEGKVFVADGEAPVLTRYAVAAEGDLLEEGRVSFQNFGAALTTFTNQLFVAARKAYWFNTAGREVVVWDPEELVTRSTFALPELPDRGAQALVGPSADRSSVVRGDRAYVPFYWADWDGYDLSNDSVILVFDTTSDRVIDSISVPCPELNFASVADDGTIYFSNWGFSAVPTLLDGEAHACAVRMLPGSDGLDPDWQLTFADVTDGHEASALRWLGAGQALITVFHHERVGLGPESDRFALTDSANWRLWMLDLGSRVATPLDTVGWHAPGLYGARLEGETFLFVPSGDYASTTTYRFSLDGTAQRRWESTGWLTRLFDLRR